MGVMEWMIIFLVAIIMILVIYFIGIIISKIIKIAVKIGLAVGKVIIFIVILVFLFGCFTLWSQLNGENGFVKKIIQKIEIAEETEGDSLIERYDRQ